MSRNGRELEVLLSDLIVWGEKVARVVAATSRVDILKDEMAEHALSRVVEVFGDLAGRIQRDFPDWCADHSPTDFSDAYRLRNKLAHGYDTIWPNLLFEIAEHDVASLVERAKVWREELVTDVRP